LNYKLEPSKIFNFGENKHIDLRIIQRNREFLTLLEDLTTIKIWKITKKEADNEYNRTTKGKKLLTTDVELRKMIVVL